MSRIAADEGRLVYIGNLPDRVSERDLDDLFAKYGRIRNIDVKMPPRPPPYAFIEYDDRRDAEDAVRGRDGKELMGMRMRVEIARGRNDRRREPGDRRERFRAPGTGFRVVVKGLPPSASWQDLKDYFRRVAPPAFTDVIRGRDGATGIVEFESGADMDRAIRQLDDTEFKNPFDSGIIRVMEDRDGPRGPPSGRGPPRGRYRSRSPPGRRYSRSPRRRDSRSPRPRRYSRSPSPPHGGSRSPPPRRGDSRSPPRGVSQSPPSRGRSVSRSPPRADDRFEMDDGRD